MSGSTVWVIIAIVVVAVVVVLLVLRSRRQRTADSGGMGLPELGALSTEGLDKEHAHGDAPTPPIAASESPAATEPRPDDPRGR